MHCINPTSLEFLELLLDWAKGVRLLALLTVWTEAAAPWQRRPGLTSITLDPLPMVTHG